MRVSSLAIGVLWLLAVLAVAATASALPADKHIALEADDGQGCVSEAKNDCYHVVNGTLEGFEQGMVVHVELTNAGSAPHNVYVTESANADPNNVDTSGDDAINGTDTISEGEETGMMFQVPEDAGGLYFWCEIDGHETLGMWLEADVAEISERNETNEPSDNNGTGGEDGAPGDDDSNGATGTGDEADADSNLLPGPGLIGLAVSAGVGLVVRDRRSR